MYIESYLSYDLSSDNVEHISTMVETLDRCSWCFHDYSSLVGYGGVVLVNEVDRRLLEEQDVFIVVCWLNRRKLTTMCIALVCANSKLLLLFETKELEILRRCVFSLVYLLLLKRKHKCMQLYLLNFVWWVDRIARLDGHMILFRWDRWIWRHSKWRVMQWVSKIIVTV